MKIEIEKRHPAWLAADDPDELFLILQSENLDEFTELEKKFTKECDNGDLFYIDLEQRQVVIRMDVV